VPGAVLVAVGLAAAALSATWVARSSGHPALTAGARSSDGASAGGPTPAPAGRTASSRVPARIPDPVVASQLRTSAPQARPLSGRASTTGDGAPERLVIPVIGVDTTLVPLGLNPDGTMEVPTVFSEAGWFTGAPEPGDPGPAVIVGHVSSKEGPAVFYRLSALQPGDVVQVLRHQGTVAKFVVDRVREYPKDAFPTDAVYGNVTGSALRLITCGGSFNSSTGHFNDNIVVYAHLVH
jgi:hypothetical protein